MPVRSDRTGLATAPRPDAQPVLRERIVLGEIVGAHGVHGEIRVRHAGDEPDHLLASEVVWLERVPNDPESRRRAVLRTGTGRGGEVRLALEGVATREAAQALVGLLVTGSPEQLPELPAGEYYWYELIGCLVESESGEQAGRVREIWETGAHDVLLVEDDRGVRRLIPTAAALMKSVDLEARRIVVVDLPGLFEPV